MKGFKRENRLLSLCGLNCGLCTMYLGKYCPGCGAGRATSHAQWQGAAYCTRRLSIAGSAVRFPVTYMRELMNMIPSSHTGTGSKT